MKKAFTLTEVLITVAIIGVVAAMTIPNLVSSYQKEALVTQLRKDVNDITQALDLVISEEGKTSLATTSVVKNENGIQDFVETHFKGVKSCTGAACFAGGYDAIYAQSSLASAPCSGKSYSLANSTAICITKTSVDDSPYLKVLIDVNGKEKPNIGGRDLFTFYVDKNAQPIGNLPQSKDVDEYTSEPAIDCKSSALGEGCFAELVNKNWKMDY